ncbi:MAG: hypothetical protein NVSMB19_06310 [Vulcanimicrobiaceae bacterium]
MAQPKSTTPPEAPEPARGNSSEGSAGDFARKGLKISTVSHTLDAGVAEQLRHFAFRERISESAVIEFALRTFFSSGDDAALGKRLRDSGAALRRKS